jgi:prolyl oligopeptidase
MSLLSRAGILALLLGISTLVTAQQSSSAVKPPAAPVKPVTDTLHGQQFTDDYRYMENAEDPVTEKWTAEEQAYTRAELDKYPQRDVVHKRLTDLMEIGTIEAPDPNKGYYFYTKREGTQNQPLLYVRKGVNGADKVLVNVNTMSKEGIVALDWWQPSHDGKYVAYGTSPGGSEISTLYVIETDTGKLLEEKIDRTRAASIAWLPDSTGFYYTKYPRPGDVPKGEEMYNRHVFFHKLGQNLDGRADAEVFGKGRDPQDWPNVRLSENGRWLIIEESEGWTKNEVYLKDLKSDSPEKAITEGKNFLYSVDVLGDDLYILTNEDAPKYRILKVSASNPARDQWKEIVPQSDAVLNSMSIIGGKLVLAYRQNANSKLEVHDADGKKLNEIALPALGQVYSINGEKQGEEAFFGFESYFIPPTVYRYDLKTTKTSEWAKVKAPVDPKAYEVKQVWYPSKDGTKISMFLVSKKGLKPNGKTPTLLFGYGGFNSGHYPTFYRWSILWLESGGVFADANLRGGDEYGEEWHRAGMLEKKQNVFDDFTSAGEYLIKEGYTDKDHLAIYGRSNGGLLTGAALTQRPDLFRAVICGVPLLDMLRYQNFQIAKLWIPEYGSAENAEQFKFISKYSPYQHVQKGTLYPAILFFASAGDTRVDPMHAKKMTALLQADAANGPDRPILLRIEPKAGHGAGKPLSIQVDEWTDIFTFLFWQIGLKPQ